VSVREQIVQAAVTQLGVISVANGYTNDLATAPYRGFKPSNIFDVAELPTVLVLDDGPEISIERLSGRNAIIQFVLFVVGYTDTPAGMNSLDVDIKRAMFADRTLGGLLNTPARADVQTERVSDSASVRGMFVRPFICEYLSTEENGL